MTTKLVRLHEDVENPFTVDAKQVFALTLLSKDKLKLEDGTAKAYWNRSGVVRINGVRVKPVSVPSFSHLEQDVQVQINNDDTVTLTTSENRTLQVWNALQFRAVDIAGGVGKIESKQDGVYVNGTNLTDSMATTKIDRLVIN